ncbi:MAG: septum formation initiator family protein [Peptococcaceae bacterium]|nr:septum formation initiator family protein [Peptococcaceae bacterium]
MANRVAAAEEKKKTVEKRVSLTVTAPVDGSQDIQVEVKRESSPGKKRSQRRFAAFMAAVLLLLAMPMIRTGISYFQLRHRLEEVRQTNQELLAVQGELQKQIENLENPAVIERLAREELGLVRPGESVVIPSIPNAEVPENEEVKPGEQLH